MLTKQLGISALVLLAVGATSAPGQKRQLDTTTFIVMGEGLAAGMANYGLSSVVQNYSFPAQMAAQMKTPFLQPLIQPPGIGDVIGYPGQEVRVQMYPQGSVRQYYQPDPTKPPGPPLFVQNLSVPGLTLADAISYRPALPVVQRGNMKQTVVNLLLGFPFLILDGAPVWTQFEYAKAQMPTVVLVELGFYETMSAAVSLDSTRIPDPAAFGANYNSVLAGLRALPAEVIATTIPNPLDTGYFSSPSVAASITSSDPALMAKGFQVANGSYLTRNALMAIANQLTTGTLGTLPGGSVLVGQIADDITARVTALNAQIVSAARTNGAVVYDLNGFLHKIKVSGAQVGNVTVTGDYLGGFYSMDAIYPGFTGHALIANDILSFLNTTYQRSFPLINVSTVTTYDTAMAVKKPTGRLYAPESFGVSR